MERYTRETVLYEIAMAIGDSLSLRDMCRTALMAFVRKLGASSGAIVHNAGNQGPSTDPLIAALPRRIRELAAFHDLVHEMGEDAKSAMRHNPQSGCYLYAFRLEQQGFLILRRAQPLDQLLLQSLPPLLRKLSIAMQACRDNERMEQSLEAARESERAKSAFLANMSHEIRTPMNAVLGFVQLLSASETDPIRQKQFEIIRSSSNNLLNIIDDILDLSKIESGKLTIEERPFQLEAMLTEVQALFKVMAKEKSLDLVFNFAPELPDYMVGDSVRIKQVLYNLLSNAVKFTPEEGRIVVDAGYDATKAMLQVAVSDTGIGIAQDSLEKIFDAFTQEDDSTTRRYGGTGLGLSITARLVKMMDGDISVASEQGQGSRFTFCIRAPQPPSPKQNVSTGAKASSATAAPMSGRVLIVEDSPHNQLLMKILLEQQGIDNDTASDGIQAVECASRRRYDLILMDEDMPNMDGIEATRRIHATQDAKGVERTPVVAVTASAMKGDRQRFLDADMTDYLSKPYQHTELTALLRKYLGAPEHAS